MKNTDENRPAHHSQNYLSQKQRSNFLNVLLLQARTLEIYLQSKRLGRARSGFLKTVTAWMASRQPGRLAATCRCFFGAVWPESEDEWTESFFITWTRRALFRSRQERSPGHRPKPRFSFHCPGELWACPVPGQLNPELFSIPSLNFLSPLLAPSPALCEGPRPPILAGTGVGPDT